MKQSEKEWIERCDEIVKPYGYKVIKIKRHRFLIFLAVLGVLIIATAFVIAQTSAMDFQLPKILTIELRLSPETLDMIKTYVNQTIQEYGIGK